MADEDDEDEFDEDEEGDEDEDGEGGKGGLSGKQTVLFIVLPVVALIGVGAWLFISGVFGGGDGEEAADGTVAEGEAEAGGEGAAAGPKAVVFYELPELLVNLNTTGRRSSFLKIKVSLELASQEEVLKLEAVMPRVVDNFQVYLRELRAEDLRGSAGIHRLREELLARVKVAAQPAVVTDVLFKEILVQ